MNTQLTSLLRSLPLLAAFISSNLVEAAEPQKPGEPIKIGFLVKQAEEPWFQDEWRFAEQAAREKGFTLIKIGTPNGEKMMAAIDNLAAQKAQGFVICAPDVKLGVAIERAAMRNSLKVMAVDDQLIDASGKPVTSIPYMGISGGDIGRQVGQGLISAMKERGWQPSEVGALRMAFDQLPTARERTMGAAEVLKAAGVPSANIIDASQGKSDTESAFNAANIAFTKQAHFKHWLVFGMNDEAVLGAVRAAESHGLKSDSLIGIGIGGSKTAQNEFAKPMITGFYGTVLISPKRHGYETALNMYKWIVDNQQPVAVTLTAGTLMTRVNQAAVRAANGL
ncbi:arabinose ABC transporter substrate-binding protein [Solimicrobium silvestre]|uniref:L-arabinose-binding periplasmic protein n=1 Tax=Solimicrobium silvestre TaxID=2099400 RepID=A0A2S9H0L8_9BURK|nr:arabinose ABC transporter substrate-binding protein [Solimicrobium silvestre]PRC93406.1 Periplasmic binding proteins and sugar binding domain of LacI family [Solimicrobium silvestre]